MNSFYGNRYAPEPVAFSSRHPYYMVYSPQEESFPSSEMISTRDANKAQYYTKSQQEKRRLSNLRKKQAKQEKREREQKEKVYNDAVSLIDKLLTEKYSNKETEVDTSTEPSESFPSPVVDSQQRSTLDVEEHILAAMETCGVDLHPQNETREDECINSDDGEDNETEVGDEEDGTDVLTSVAVAPFPTPSSTSSVSDESSVSVEDVEEDDEDFEFVENASRGSKDLEFVVQPVPLEELWAKELEILSQLGFNNVSTNIRLLEEVVINPSASHADAQVAVKRILPRLL